MVDNRVATFIDVDNVLIGAQNSGLPFNLSLIIDRVRQEGIMMSSKAYADWTSNLLKPVLADFRTNAIEQVQLPTSVANSIKDHKNTADIQLAVDALEMALSSVPPQTIVIVGGDRDFVPLVQKLKRYGVRVVGIGVEAGVSRVLIEASDSFVFYDDLIPPEPEEAGEPPARTDPAVAYSLMRRAVETLSRDGRSTAGSTVVGMMMQLDPAFDVARYRMTMKKMAQNAQETGHVRITEHPGSDFTLSVDTAADPPAAPESERAVREYDYSTPAVAVASYRTILQEHRIPLLPWKQRSGFLKRVWEGFDSRAPVGLSFNDIRELILDHATDEGISVSTQAIQKFLYTLNFARCFSLDPNSREGNIIQIPADVERPLDPAVDEPEAIRRLHKNYLIRLTREGARLDPDAVYALLYGDQGVVDDDALIFWRELEEMCNQVQPPNAFEQALRAARQS
jgi:uncharacterized LabA/DUF88 family protein